MLVVEVNCKKIFFEESPSAFDGMSVMRNGICQRTRRWVNNSANMIIIFILRSTNVFSNRLSLCNYDMPKGLQE